MGRPRLERGLTLLKCDAVNDRFERELVEEWPCIAFVTVFIWERICLASGRASGSLCQHD